jgi:hypothetical protein
MNKSSSITSALLFGVLFAVVFMQNQRITDLENFVRQATVFSSSTTALLMDLVKNDLRLTKEVMSLRCTEATNMLDSYVHKSVGVSATNGAVFIPGQVLTNVFYLENADELKP